MLNYYDYICKNLKVTFYDRFDMDKNTLEFVTYCISTLASRLGLTQRDVYRKLLDSGILYGYIVPSYDVLHTFGSNYLMDDLTGYMKEKGVLPSYD